MMQPLDRSRYGEWDRFVSRANGTIFHTSWWYEAWGVDFDIYVRCGQDGEIEAGMPVHIGRYKHLPRLFGVKGLTRPPLTAVNGPLFLASKKIGRSDRYAHAKKEVLDAINSLPKTGYYDILLHSLQDDLMPYIWNGFDTQVYYTYVIPAAGGDTWRVNMAGRMRNYLRGAHKEADESGCRIEVNPPMADVLPLLFDTAQAKGYSMKRSGSKLPSWWMCIKEREAGRSYLLRDKDDRALCASIMVWDNHSSYFVFNGILSDERRRKGHLNMLLFERMISDSIDMGLDFDFEGSTLMGVEGFIRRWGGELRRCYRVMKFPSAIAYMGFKGYRYLKMHRKRDWTSTERV